MNTETVMTEEQLIRQAIDALIKSLGIMEATHFLAIKHENRLKSVGEHNPYPEKPVLCGVFQGAVYR